MDNRTTGRWRHAALAAMIALCLLIFAVQTWRLDGQIGSDAEIFHKAVQRVLADPALLYWDDTGIINTAEALQGFLYPPPSMKMLLPFGLGTLEQGHALLSWSALVAAILSVLAWLVLAERLGLVATGKLERTAIVAMTAITGAVFNCRLGQVDTLILAIVTGGVWAAWQGSPRVGGALLALGSWTKIYPALLMLPLLADRERRWPALTGYAAAALVVLGIALLVFPLSVWREFSTMLPIMAERTIVNIYNQSFAAVWARTTIPAAQALSSFDSVVVPLWLRAGVSLAALAAIAGFIWRARRAGAPPLWIAAAATAIISLVAPLGWGHSYAYVLPLLALCLAVAWARGSWGALALALGAWALLVIPAHRQFPMLSEGGLLWHLAYARYTLAGVGLLALGWWQMGRRGADA